MDEHGECFGGYFKDPAFEHDFSGAYELSGKRHIRLLYELPYPCVVIQAAAKLLCPRRQESVREVRELCEWTRTIHAKGTGELLPLAEVRRDGPTGDEYGKPVATLAALCARTIAATRTNEEPM